MRLPLQLATPLAETAGRIVALPGRAREELTAGVELQHDAVAELSLGRKSYAKNRTLLEVRNEVTIQMMFREEGLKVSDDLFSAYTICLRATQNGVDVEG